MKPSTHHNNYHHLSLRDSLTSLLCELTVILFSCGKLNKLNRGDRGHEVGGGDRIICSCTSGNVNGSSNSEVKSWDIRLASSDTISSILSTKLSRDAITFCMYGLSCLETRSACISSSIFRHRPGVKLNVEMAGDVIPPGGAPIRRVLKLTTENNEKENDWLLNYLKWQDLFSCFFLSDSSFNHVRTTCRWGVIVLFQSNFKVMCWHQSDTGEGHWRASNYQQQTLPFMVAICEKLNSCTTTTRLDVDWISTGCTGRLNLTDQLNKSMSRAKQITERDIFRT